MWKHNELHLMFLTFMVSLTCLVGGSYTPVVVFSLRWACIAWTSFFGLFISVASKRINRKLP